jgi:hypothetical protein
MATKDAVMTAGTNREREKGRLLGDPDVGLGGVAQDKQVEPIELTGCRKRLVDRLQPGHDPSRRFVIGRHQKRGADAKVR